MPTALLRTTYDGTTVLICWHHEEALALAEALGVPKRLPSTLPWAPRWPEGAFGWVLVITYGADGEVDFGRTTCVTAELMYGDCCNGPPGAVF